MKQGVENFDGVLCFGQVDWWYHNRTHFDLQIMREFSRDVPVLYVNSIGMRLPSPSEGKMFFSRVLSKGKSFLRGLKKIRDGFYVFSPVSVPGSSGAAWGKTLLSLQVRVALRRAGIKNPLIWVGCPTAISVLSDLPHRYQIYQRTDRYEDYTGVDARYIKEIDEQLKESSDLTVFCSSLLYKNESAQCKKALYVEHGVDYEYFSSAGIADVEPADLQNIKHPRAVYVGGMEEGIFDEKFLLQVAKRLPDWSFILVGDSTFRDGWSAEQENVLLLGKREYEEVGAYMAAGDVLIMPWCRNEWIAGCNPVKMKEYLAVGRGVVSTPFYELRQYKESIRSAASVDEFVQAIVELYRQPVDPEFLRERVKDITWQKQAGIIWTELGVER